MEITIQSAKNFQELLELPAHDMPYFFERIFNTDGFWAKRLSKEKFGLLKAIDEQIRQMLKPGEKVCFITWGVDSSSSIDALLLGHLIDLLNRMAIILTTMRILMIQVDSSNKPLRLKAQLKYQSINKIKRSLFGESTIHLKNGNKLIFSHLPKEDRKFMQKLLNDLRADLSSLPPDNTGKEDLCPHCNEPIRNKISLVCPSCHGKFKEPFKAVLRSLVFPGLGDLYLGTRSLRSLAIFKMLIAAFLWIVLVGSIISGENKAELPEIILTIVVFHFICALITYAIARKGLYPAKEQ